METKVAVVSIIVESPDAVPALNALLHDYSAFIIGRLGLPYREKNVNVICVAMDAPLDRINTLTGALGRIPGINAKAVCSNV